MEYWMNFTFVMVSFFTPILIAIKHDFNDIGYKIKVIMIPVTVAWVLLIVILFVNIRTISKHLQKIRDLKNE
jgi:hypothetical protein